MRTRYAFLLLGLLALLPSCSTSITDTGRGVANSSDYINSTRRANQQVAGSRPTTVNMPTPTERNIEGQEEEAREAAKVKSDGATEPSPLSF